MKKIILIFLCLLTIVSGKNVNGLNQSFDKQSAIQNAYWKAFEPILKNLTGYYAYKGSVKDSFRKDFEKDFETFKNEYFDYSTFQCENKGENGFLCLVSGSINEDKIRAILSQKSNSMSSMGKNRMSKLKIVLIDDIANEFSKDFIMTLQADLNNSGHSFTVMDKGTILGKNSTVCKKIEKQIKKFKKMGNGYKSAVEAAKEKLNECESNKNVEYAFTLDKLTILTNSKTTSGEYSGTLTYRIKMFNTQTRKQDQSVKPNTIKAFAFDKAILKTRLYEKASKVATRDMTNNLLSFISKKNIKGSKKITKLESYQYMYSIVLMGITMDGADRGKRKLIRDAIKKFNAKPLRSSNESTDFEQVYSFGLNEEIDIEDFMDTLYDLSDSVGIPIQITDNGNNILNIQFQ